MKNDTALLQLAIKQLVTCRTVELFISNHYKDGLFRCPIHLAIGHEAIPASLLSVFSKNRFVFSYHRSHHHFLCSGASVKSLLLELGGHPEGCCLGHGGSHHLLSKKHGFMGSTSIISGTIPVATGFAHALKIDQRPERVFCFAGDSIAEEGVFYESLNAASLYQLPITFIVEDNGLSCFTPKVQRHGFRSYEDICRTFQIRYYDFDGSNLQDCLKKSLSHASDLEDYNGPALIHASVFRPYEHCGYQIEENQSYRDISGDWPRLDPLHNLKNFLSESELTELANQIEEWQNDVLTECNYALAKLEDFLQEFIQC